jgi:hypothetical protein
MSCLVVIGTAALLLPSSVAAQQPPPISGVTGTVALEGTVKREYEGAHAIVVGAVDGSEHVFRAAKDLLVHGSDKKGEDALRDLRAGMTVVVHYTDEGSDELAHEVDRVGGADGLQVDEGIVTHVDHGRRQIGIRLGNGTIETLQLTDRAAAESGRDQTVTNGARVAVYYTDKSGKRVVHYFKVLGA